MLDEGSDYIGFLSTSEYRPAPDGFAQAGSLRNESAYLDGQFYWQNNGDNEVTWNSQSWSQFSDFGDLAFTATFSSAVPEPSTYAMFGIAFVGLGVVGYRRRRTA